MTEPTATIAWDGWGVAHISGPDEESVFRALGWAQSASHLEEVLAQWKLVLGQLADVLGPGAAAADMMSTTFDHLGAARRAFSAAPPAMQRRHAAFVDGVRRWLAAHPDQQPDWMPELEECLPLGTVRAQTWPWCIADALSGALGATADRGSADDRGSNWWAVSGDRTADGVPYLLSDPHLPLGGLTHVLPEGAPPRPLPGLELLEVSLRCPGLEVTGFVVAGTAFPMLGHNRDLAWGFTTGGPVTSGIGPAGVTTTYDDGAERMEAQLWRLATATSVAEVVDGWDAGGLFPQNVLVVDATGDSWYVRTGRTVRDGVEVTRDDLVQLRGMPDGWVQNCNSAPDLVAADLAITAGKGADVVNDTRRRHTSRSRRLHEILPTLQGVSHDGLVELATDDVWPDTRFWQDALRRAAPDEPLLDFDGRAVGESRDALRWLLWREAVARAGGSAELCLRILAGQPSDADLAVLRDALPPVSDATLADLLRFGRGADQPGTNVAFNSFAPDPTSDESESLAIQAPLRVMGFFPGPAARPVTFGGCFLRLTRLEPGNVRSWSVVLPGLASRPGHLHADDQWGFVRARQVRPVAASWDEALADAVFVEGVEGG